MQLILLNFVKFLVYLCKLCLRRTHIYPQLAYQCIIEGGKSSVLISRFTPIGKNMQVNRRISAFSISKDIPCDNEYFTIIEKSRVYSFQIARGVAIKANDRSNLQISLSNTQNKIIILIEISKLLSRLILSKSKY